MGVEIAHRERLGDPIGPVLFDELFFVFLGKTWYVFSVKCLTQIDKKKPIDPISGPSQDKIREMIIQDPVNSVWLEVLHY